MICATFLHGWRSVRHEAFRSTLPIPDGFVVTIRCQICGDYMSLGAANDKIPRHEMRMAKDIAEGQVSARRIGEALWVMP
jgi:hypothetical protein